MALHLVYKKIGETPLEALNRKRQEENIDSGVSMTYAGRLDPAAEGLLLILSEKDVYRKEEFLRLSKTYEFEVLFGVTTDTLDVVGLVDKNVSSSESVPYSVLNILSNFVGSFEWQYPKFSSKTVNGKPLFMHAKESNDIDVPYRNMTIDTLDILSMKTVSLNDLRNQIIATIRSIHGDFRQEEILESWGNVFDLHKDKQMTVICFNAEVWSGTYIRVLAQKMAESLGLPGMALSIKRTKIGNMSLS